MAWERPEGTDWSDARDVAIEVNNARSVPAGTVPAGLVDLIAQSLGNGDVVDAALGAVPDAFLESVLERLLDYEDTFPEEPVGAIVAIANLRPRLRTGRAGMFDPGADILVERLILRLLRRVEPEERRSEIALEAYGRIKTLTARLWLALLVGHRENVGHGLVPEAVQATLGGQASGRHHRNPAPGTG